MAGSRLWTEEEDIINHFKVLLDNKVLDYVVERSQALVHKTREYAGVDDEVWFLLAKRASAEWRTLKESEGVILPNRNHTRSPPASTVSVPGVNPKQIWPVKHQVYDPACCMFERLCQIKSQKERH